MSFQRTIFAGLLVALMSGPAAVAAQEEQVAQGPVMIYDYAVNHPTEDAQLPAMPTIGASVPEAIVVSTADETGDTVYGYFYFQGRPVIVDLTTRSVVRFDN